MRAPFPERRPYRSWVEISRFQIAENYRSIQSAVGANVAPMPVVKADAYRHGAVEVARILVAQGARWLAVSNTDEGIVLRDAGITCRILLMADMLPFTREVALQRDLTPVIHTLSDLAELNRLAERLRLHPRYHLKLDTGMGRLGVLEPASAIADAIHAAKHLQLDGVMTHFASSGNYESGQTESQMKAFQSAVNVLAAAGIHPPHLHLSSTIPVAYGRREAWQHIVRPGHAIYGYVSPPREAAPRRQVIEVKPALSWRASILALKDLPAGALVGYGGMYQAPKPMRIAVLAAGYADGIPHRLSNRGNVIVRGKLMPILGAVSMDLTTVDVTGIDNLSVGDPVTLLGSEGSICIDAQQIARLAGTISYSVLCGIHARVKRIYLD